MGETTASMSRIRLNAATEINARRGFSFFIIVLANLNVEREGKDIKSLYAVECV